MKKLSCMTSARLTAFVLLVILLPVTILLSAGWVYCFTNGWYSDLPGFSETTLAERYISTNIDSVCMHAGDNYGDLSGFSRDNLSFVVRDATGVVISDTRGADASPVYDGDERMLGIDRLENGDFYYSFRDFSQKVSYDELYSLQFFIEMPVEPDSTCWLFFLCYSTLLQMLDLFFPLAILGVAVTSALFIFLLLSAGRHMTEDGQVMILLRGLDRVPSDIFLILCAVGLSFNAALASSLNYYYDPFWSYISLAVILLIAASIFFALCLSFAARFKTRAWWQNSLIYRTCCVICRALRLIAHTVPTMWRVTLIFVGFTAFNIIGGIMILNGAGFMLILLAFVNCAALLWLLDFARQLRELDAAGKALSAGDLDYKVDTELLRGELRGHGQSLNSVSVGMSRAVNERMKSERFKTELITNVSHDLKTPLTSIVSYVELLKTEQIDNGRAQSYIEVIDRQSKKLKKLTEDLVEASKASSGAISVSLERLNAAELLNQSAGEYAESFRAAGLIPVISLPETEPIIMADGRLLWRVFDNLLHNACKYALPGTRLYLSLTSSGGWADISFKNISREELNISADELLERFTRGDTSRSTEGSGLGLAIANSLTELMGGRLSISLDGDLFKIVLSFPTV